MKVDFIGKRREFTPEKIKETIDAFDTLIYYLVSLQYPNGCERAAMESVDIGKVKDWWVEFISNTDEYKQYVKEEQKRINEWCEGKIAGQENPRWELHIPDGRVYRKNYETGDWYIEQDIKIENE